MSAERHQPGHGMPEREWQVFEDGYVKELPKLMEIVQAFFGSDEGSIQAEVAFSVNASRFDLEYFVPRNGEYVGLIIQFETLVPERLVDAQWRGSWKKV